MTPPKKKAPRRPKSAPGFTRSHNHADLHRSVHLLHHEATHLLCFFLGIWSSGDDQETIEQINRNSVRTLVIRTSNSEMVTLKFLVERVTS